MTYPTLAHHLSGQVFTPQRLECSVADVVPNMNAVVTMHGKYVKPYKEALTFYFSNHIKQVLCSKYHPDQPVSEAHNLFLEMYALNVATLGARAFHYLLGICTRETRHVLSLDSHLTQYTYPEEYADFLRKIKHLGSTGAHEALLFSPPNLSLIEYVKLMSHVFRYGSFKNSYGGEAWATVTDCLYQFVTGKISLEVMVDTVWTLAHNTGPIFNKGFLYNDEDGSSNLILVLDVQRAGCTPQLVGTANTCGYFERFRDNSLVNLAKKHIDLVPEFAQLLDFDYVEEMGAVHQYHMQKQAIADYLHSLDGLNKPAEPPKPTPKKESKTTAKSPTLDIDWGEVAGTLTGTLKTQAMPKDTNTTGGVGSVFTIPHLGSFLIEPPMGMVTKNGTV